MEQVVQALNEYRRERSDSPQFYYNELAERSRAVADFRPILENFMAGNLNLADFRQAAARFNMTERMAARGREQGRYWRFSGAGRLWLDSLYKNAEQAGRLNVLAQLLQETLKAPASLDEATGKFRQLNRLRQDLLAMGGARQNQGGIQTGLAIYVLSYFWAVQDVNWPIYSRGSRASLVKIGYLAEKTGLEPDDAYSSFYLAFQKLGNELGTTTWELESFLHWYNQLSSLEARILATPRHRSQSSAVTRQRLASLEELRAALDRKLRHEISPAIRSVASLKNGIETIEFKENEQPFRLLILLDKPTRAGLAFEGFSPVLLGDHNGKLIFNRLADFLKEQNGYEFYTGTGHPPQAPTVGDLTREFYLLKSFSPDKQASVEAIVNEWRILYQIARNLVVFSEEPEQLMELLEAALVEAETDSPYAYPVEEENWLQAIAEIRPFYGAGATTEEQGALPFDEEDEQEERQYLYHRANRQAESEAQRLAHLQPKPLRSEQAEAIQAYIEERLVIRREKISEIIAHLEAGRNVILFGPPGCGKTRLARLLAGQICSPRPGHMPEKDASNYTLATATAEWSVYDVIGGIRPGLVTELEEMAAQPADIYRPSNDQLQYFFEPGVVSRAALACEASLRANERPHYLIIDEFNRANQDRAFGELFTLLEYRDRPLLPAGKLGRQANLYLPDSFRIIGTLNSEDHNSLFEFGLALRRRFALVEIELPPPDAEKHFLPKMVKARLPEVELTAGGEFASPYLREASDKLFTFVSAVRPDPHNPAAGGKKLGTALLVDTMVFCAVASRYYQRLEEALEDAILADILPQLDHSTSAVTRALRVVTDGGPLAEMLRLRAILQRMAGTRASYF